MNDAAAQPIALMLSGGAALGAYQAGACARLIDAHGDRLTWVAGSSIGAVNGALLAGNPPERRAEQLRRFWTAAAAGSPFAAGAPWTSGPLRHAFSWFGALQARMTGSPLFRPRPLVELLSGQALSIYDLSPLEAMLPRFLDFERLNGGELRFSVVTTDLESGEPVVFDTAAGSRIEPAHILASSGFLPDFQPVEIGGRLLGDGTLVEHVPAGVVLGAPPKEALTCFLIDALARAAPPPRSLERAAERRLDLLVTSQTRLLLDSLCRENRLRRLLNDLLDEVPAARRQTPELAEARAAAQVPGVTLLALAYRAPPEEAGPEKQFDYSPATLADRWAAGAKDMEAALRVMEELPKAPSVGLAVHRVGQSAVGS